jgi:hypothetical protein
MVDAQYPDEPMGRDTVNTPGSHRHLLHRAGDAERIKKLHQLVGQKYGAGLV